jgi:arylformamidase
VRIYDISLTISEEMPIYGDDPPVEIEPISRISKGDGANVSLLRLGSHTGTHVDAPFHFVEGGTTIDGAPLDVLVGECYVCEVQASEAITVPDIESCGLPDGCRRILFKTSNSLLWEDDRFHTDFVYLDPEAADWLVDRGIQLVGIDYLSVDRFKSGAHPTHMRLLGSGAVAIEGLDLREVTQGTFFLVCLPLKIRDGDAAPARVILIEGVGG